MPFDVGVPELILILVIIMLVFGVGKLPEVGGAIGRGIREFRKASTEPGDAKAEELPTSERSGDGWRCAACSESNPARNRFCGACGAAKRVAVASAFERSEV